MTGPQHFSEGQRRLAASDSLAADGKTQEATYEALAALGHFAAALTALHAQQVAGDRVSWKGATDG